MDERMKKLCEGLRTLEIKCDNEAALRSQIEYVINLYFEIRHMNAGVFHGYEKKIFEAALPIFMEHMISQIEVILEIQDLKNPGRVMDKRALIEDIQSAVGKMVEIYQSIAGSINNVEQPVFPVMHPNMYVFDASLKMLAQYSDLLNRASGLFEQNTYAFLLYPFVSDIIKTEVLFKKREEKGKVVVVTFPEKLVNSPKVIPVLFHEAFHVIERNMRERRLRAACYIECVVYALQFFLFREIRFSEDDNVDGRIKDNLMEKWFGDLAEGITREYNELPEDSRELYAQKIAEKIEGVFTRGLIDINDHMVNDMISQTALERQKGGNKRESLREYQDNARGLETKLALFKHNYFEILTNRLLKVFGSRYIYMFREGFADVASCLFLALTPQDYEDAFQLSVKSGFSADGFIDRERVTRQHIVYSAVASVKAEKEEQGEWMQQAEKCMKVLKESPSSPVSQPGGIPDAQTTISSVEIPLDDNMVGFFLTYLCKVAERMSAAFDGMDGLGEFRELMERIRDNEEAVKADMLIGKNDQQ